MELDEQSPADARTAEATRFEYRRGASLLGQFIRAVTEPARFPTPYTLAVLDSFKSIVEVIVSAHDGARREFHTDLGLNFSYCPVCRWSDVEEKVKIVRPRLDAVDSLVNSDGGRGVSRDVLLVLMAELAVTGERAPMDAYPWDVINATTHRISQTWDVPLPLQTVARVSRALRTVSAQ